MEIKIEDRNERVIKLDVVVKYGKEKRKDKVRYWIDALVRDDTKSIMKLKIWNELQLIDGCRRPIEVDDLTIQVIQEVVKQLENMGYRIQVE